MSIRIPAEREFCCCDLSYHQVIFLLSLPEAAAAWISVRTCRGFKNDSGVLAAPRPETESLLPLSAAAHHLVRGARETRCAREHLVHGARETRCARELPEVYTTRIFVSAGSSHPENENPCFRSAAHVSAREAVIRSPGTRIGTPGG